MLDIPPHISSRLHKALSNCGPFDNALMLRAAFSDARIATWRGKIPDANSPDERVRVTVDFLRRKYDEAGNNALVLFLIALSEGIDLQDACHQELIEIASELGSYDSTAYIPFRDVPHAPLKLYPGLNAFSAAEKEIFYGRKNEVSSLITRISQDPLIIVNGPSGSGKSSLIKAGVIPNLEKLNYLVIYASVFENILQDISYQLKSKLGAYDLQLKWFELLQELHQQTSSYHVVLIVDQFEQALNDSLAMQNLKDFVTGIARLINEARRFITIVIVVRSDWLYFLENSVRQSYPRLNMHSCIFTLDPLDKQGAHAAIVKPLQAHNIPYEQEVVEHILNALQHSSSETILGNYIDPIQLQIVLHALASLAEQGGCFAKILTKEIYDLSGGVERILRNYLVDAVGRRPNVWRLLALFVTRDGKKSRTRRHSELLAAPIEDIGSEVEFLVDQGFIEVYEAERVGDNYYRLSHDYLIEAIVEYLNQNPDQQGWKLGEDWLTNGVLAG